MLVRKCKSAKAVTRTTKVECNCHRCSVLDWVESCKRESLLSTHHNVIKAAHDPVGVGRELKAGGSSGHTDSHMGGSVS